MYNFILLISFEPNDEFQRKQNIFCTPKYFSFILLTNAFVNFLDGKTNSRLFEKCLTEHKWLALQRQPTRMNWTILLEIFLNLTRSKKTSLPKAEDHAWRVVCQYVYQAKDFSMDQETTIVFWMLPYKYVLLYFYSLIIFFKDFQTINNDLHLIFSNFFFFSFFSVSFCGMLMFSAEVSGCWTAMFALKMLVSFALLR